MERQFVVLIDLYRCLITRLRVSAVTARQQVNAAAKRARGGSSSDEFIRSDGELERDAELERSDDERRASDSDMSDSNPFRAGSDSDDGA